MRHATFKQEILDYGYINIYEYNNLIIPKAKQYLKTAVCKTVNIKFNPHLHFDIEAQKLTKDNLIALILYTDFAQLSKEFASTFRQIRYYLFVSFCFYMFTLIFCIVFFIQKD